MVLAEHATTQITGEAPSNFPNTVWVLTLFFTPFVWLLLFATLTFVVYALYGITMPVASVSRDINNTAGVLRSSFLGRVFLGRPKQRAKAASNRRELPRVLGLIGILVACFTALFTLSAIANQAAPYLPELVVTLDYHPIEKFGEILDKPQIAFIGEERISIAKPIGAHQYSFTTKSRDVEK